MLDEINLIFNSYDLAFELYPQSKHFEIIKRKNKRAFKYPYSSVADTLQRLIFYFAIIDSNKNSILLLEEPEVHSFPPYTRSLAHRIENDKSNQYFITTHSPYLLESLIEHCDENQIQIYLTYYENWETKVLPISYDLITEYMNSDFDIFFNLDQIKEESLKV